MTDLEKAARQALEVLTDIGQLHPDDYKEKKNDAITDLRTAIEQMEKKHPAEIDPLPRACNLAGVDYRIYLKIKSYMPVTPAAQPAPVQKGN